MKVEMSESLFAKHTLIGSDGKLAVQRASDNAHKLLEEWLARHHSVKDELTFLVIPDKAIKAMKKK